MQEDTSSNESLPEHDRPPRNRAQLVFTITLFLVIVLLLVAIFSPLRDVVVNRFLTAAPTPTATLVAGDDLIDLQATPAGTITIDGHAISACSDKCEPYLTDKPIRLSRGQHKIVWQAPPFLPLTCIISVPPVSTEPCNEESTGNDPNAPGEREIAFSAIMADLPLAQQTAVKQAIQAALNTLQATDVVQPGEQYLSPSGTTLVKTATQPLQATLQFHLDANPASQNICQNACSFNGQNCLQICTAPNSGIPATKTAQLTWDMYALFYPTWTYTTQSGRW